MLGLFGPLALILQLIIWTLGLLFGYALLEWAVGGGSFADRVLSSSGLFLSAGAAEGSYGVRAVQLLEMQGQKVVGRKLWEVSRQRGLQKVVRRALAEVAVSDQSSLNWTRAKG